MIGRGRAPGSRAYSFAGPFTAKYSAAPADNSSKRAIRINSGSDRADLRSASGDMAGGASASHQTAQVPSQSPPSGLRPMKFSHEPKIVRMPTAVHGFKRVSDWRPSLSQESGRCRLIERGQG